MQLSGLIDFFCNFSRLPVEIPVIREHLIEHGIQDEIIFHPVDADPAKLRGIFYKFKRLDAAYSHALCSLVIYNQRLSPAWQRLVCCKEMIHILDSQLTTTSTREQVSELVDRLLTPLGASIVSVQDIAAVKDHIATYQALAVLFPADARAELLEPYKQGRITADQIADAAELPPEFIPLLMSDAWEAFQDAVRSTTL